MSIYYQQQKALAGQIATAQNAVTVVTEYNHSGVTVQAGQFVAIREEGGVQLPKTASDKVLGVVLRTPINASYKDGEALPVATLRAGEAIWVSVKAGQSFKRGEVISITFDATAEADTGKATKETGKIKTSFVVLDTAETLVLVSPL